MTDTPTSPVWGPDEFPFHEGELAIQERLGVRDKIAAQSRQNIRKHLTEEHRSFFSLLPYVFVGSVDATGQPWASMLLGEPGFVEPEGPNSVIIRARALFGDPLLKNLKEGAEVAILGVQFHTRRRNRFSGRISYVRDGTFGVEVRQSLGICPQYIQGREPIFTRNPLHPVSRPLISGNGLDPVAREIIERADTYFVASANLSLTDGAARGVDVSHRGGRPGFVRVDDEKTLTAPDFVGNFMFNTIGNWQRDSRAGLLFIDFKRGDLVYAAAHAEVIWEGPELRAFTGAQRLVRYHIETAVRVMDSLPARFTAAENSPLLVRTGTWGEVTKALDAEKNRNEWRPLRIVRFEDESATIRSLYVEAADGLGLAGHEPGQFLPIRVHPTGWASPATRNYTISKAPGDASYRISVKREGNSGVSDWLHSLAVGAEIEAIAPRGKFTFVTNPKTPAVLISIGAGITPMIAFVDSIFVNGGRTRHHAPIWFVHGARQSTTHAFGEYIRTTARQNPSLRAHVRYSRPLQGDAIGITHDSEGAIDINFLQALLPPGIYDFYLCGPSKFMQGLYDGLPMLGARDSSIYFESFGTTSVQRRKELTVQDTDTSEAIPVVFARSGKTGRWHPGNGSLLDIAESLGISPLYSCRVGVCGTCATSVLDGGVDYAEIPAHAIPPGEALICCATPHPGPHLGGSLDREGVVLDL